MESPPFWQRLVMFHFAGGDAYLVAILAAAMALGLLWTQATWTRSRTVAGMLIAALWSLASGEPASLVVQGVVLIGIVAGLVLTRKDRRPARSLAVITVIVGGSLIFLTATAVLARWPVTIPATAPRLYVIGDSITAGLNDHDDTWPRQLARTSSWQITDASQPGATVASAVRQLDFLPMMPEGLLLMEIGGNDILEGLPVARYREGLDRLLLAATRKAKTVVLLELPWPPLNQPYAAIERDLARRYGVLLVPRRRFAGVLTSGNATVDGIHLSNIGATAWAEWMKAILPSQANLSEGHREHVGP